MRQILLLAVAQCAVLGSLTAPAVVGLSLMVQRLVGPEDAPAVLSVAVACGSAVAMIANPVLGWCADRFPRRLGGRRAWLVAGALLGLAGSWQLATATSIAALTLAWVATQAAYNACFGAINGLLSARLRPRDRVRASGIFTAAGFVGTLPGLGAAALFPTDVIAMTLVVPVVAALAILAVAPFVRDGSGSRGIVRAAPTSLRSLLSRPFLTAFVVRFLLSAELTAGLVFGLFLFQERWDLGEEEAVRLVSTATLAGAVGLVIAAVILSARPRRRPSTHALVVVSLTGVAIAMVGRAVAPTPLVFLAVTVVAGAAIGIGMTATRAVVQAQVGTERAALGLGIFNIANTLAPVVAPLASTALLGIGRAAPFSDAYVGFYLLLAAPVIACVVALAMPRLRLPEATIDGTAADAGAVVAERRPRASR